MGHPDAVRPPPAGSPVDDRVRVHESSRLPTRETLARNPNHFGALSGQGLCHLALGEYREAADLFRRTLAVHPHLDSARQNLRAAILEVVKWN